MNIFTYLDDKYLEYISDEKKVMTDVIYLDGLIRENQGRWINDLTEVEEAFVDEGKKTLALEMIGSFRMNINKEHGGNDYERDHFFVTHWDCSPIGAFELLARIILPEPPKKIENKNSYNVCCLAAIESFKVDNGYTPSVNSVLERLINKPPEGYGLVCDSKNKVITVGGATPVSYASIKKRIKNLLQKDNKCH